MQKQDDIKKFVKKNLKLTLYPPVVSPAFLFAKTHFILMKKNLSSSNSATPTGGKIFVVNENTQRYIMKFF